MKRALLEKGIVLILFVLVIVAFSFAERDTQKAFEKYNMKNTVEAPKQPTDYTAEAAEKTNSHNKSTRN